MRTPDKDIYIVMGRFCDGSGTPTLFAAYESEEEACRLRDTILESEPSKDIYIYLVPYWPELPMNDQ